MGAPIDSNILIVEDDEALRDVLCETAEMAGYTTFAAPHGNAALDIFATKEVDLVISDIQMEPLDGNALLREIRKRDRDVPVVLMTAYGSIQSAVDAMRHGATDYLVKPFEAAVLLGHIDQWMRPSEEQSTHRMIADDDNTKAVVELAKRVAPSDAAVLITGESGGGERRIF